MSKVYVTFTVERGEAELELEVAAEVSTYVAARRYGHPDAWSPSEGGEVEVEAVTLGGAPWTGELTKDESERLDEKIAEAAAEEDGGDDGPEWDEGIDW